MAATLYDSEKVRIAAKAVRALSGDLEEGFMGPQRGAMQEAERLKGRAAAALVDRLAELNARLNGICEDLDDLGGELNAYASALEASAEKLKAAMQLRGIRQEQLAKRLGLKNQASISFYLKDIYNVDAVKILMMSDILGISIFDIMTKYWKEEKA